MPLIHMKEDATIFHVNGSPIDALITEWCAKEPIPHLYQSWKTATRAILWNHPNQDWRWIAMVPPRASRMGLLRNPVFSNLVRQWGLHLKLFGLDRIGLLRDFTPTLSDDLLSKLLSALRASESDDGNANAVLDVVFSAIERQFDLFDPNERSFPGHGIPLMTHGIFNTLSPHSILAHVGQFKDLTIALKEAVITGVLEKNRFFRIHASVETREILWRNALLQKLQQSLPELCPYRSHSDQLPLDAGLYNWYRFSERHREPRKNFLRRMPFFWRYATDVLLPINEVLPFQPSQRRRVLACGCHLGDAHNEDTHLEEDFTVQQAIDSGQDRLIIKSVAYRYKVAENTVRALWRNRPHLPLPIQPWQLSPLLSSLNELPDRAWPGDREKWALWINHCFPRND